ncbi:YlbF family regulator [Alicyclobacillus mali (ex Roth et al. 2021)]|uniref:YlbF family regulator n=1 Tax=Alicyclobacillus mali (ex Roth et al. 2021) TaxID=1123961 RepID=UPI001A8E1F3D|nr:YlbF family regulator [Alicyclobacillus mali (ex Roth et al. 2021)]
MDRGALWDKASELARLIADSEQAQRYRDAKVQLDGSPQAQSMLRRFRELQEAVAEFQARRVPPMHYRHVIEEADRLLAQMRGVPEIASYEQAERELNELLDEVSSRLQRALSLPPDG